MESKNLIIIFAWVFLILFWILTYFGGWDAFIPFMMIFIVIIISIAVSFAPSETKSDSNLSKELKEIKNKLDETAKDVEEIKKIIEE